MTRRRLFACLLSLAALAALAAIALALVCGGTARAADIPASGVRLTGSQHWHTCVPRMIGYRGQYRIENDLFAGKHGRLCIRSTGDNLTITTSMHAQPGGVVAAPGIRVGPWYGSGDPQSDFPVSVRAMPRIVDHVTSNCRAPGQWLVDTDTYGYTSAAAVTGNPAAELVIANCWQNIAVGGRLAHVSGHWWRVSHHITSGGAQGPHMLIIFSLARQSGRVAEAIPAFVWWTRHHGWWPGSARVIGASSARIVGNTCLQAELWSGGRGLTLGLRVTDTSPVIRPLGGGS